jgi:hypothetical protein
MGAWGIHFDECDGALDFLGDVADSRDWADVEARIAGFVADGGYEDAEEAIAALELVAAALGRPSPRLSAELADWARGHASQAASLKQKSIEAADIVASRSELSELWAEAEEGADWQATIADLKSRLEV